MSQYSWGVVVDKTPTLEKGGMTVPDVSILRYTCTTVHIYQAGVGVAFSYPLLSSVQLAQHSTSPRMMLLCLMQNCSLASVQLCDTDIHPLSHTHLAQAVVTSSPSSQATCPLYVAPQYVIPLHAAPMLQTCMPHAVPQYTATPTYCVKCLLRLLAGRDRQPLHAVQGRLQPQVQSAEPGHHQVQQPVH